MTATIIRGDARHLPLEDESVDLIVTSPPYLGLRSYTDGGQHYHGQIGSEATPQEFVKAMMECVAEMVRVLKPSGSIFLNLGDKYNNQGGRNGHTALPGVGRFAGGQPVRRLQDVPVAPKSLLGLPWRVALACTDQLGLTLRAEIIWAKPNGLPESVTDRVRRAHEQVFHFTRQPRYYTAIDEIREPHQPQSIARTGRNRFAPDLSQPAWGSPNTLNPADACNPLGKLPGSVWSIPSAPLTVPPHLGIDHFAAYPPALIRPIILGWSPAGICTACGEGRRPVPTAQYHDAGGRGNEKFNRVDSGHGDYLIGSFKPQEMRFGRANRTTTITGYVCACAQPTAPTRPSVVVDPFGGTGTTALVASAHGRHGISVDMSADYCRLAQWRCNDPSERARALDVPKPPMVMDGQLTFDELEAGAG